MLAATLKGIQGGVVCTRSPCTLGLMFGASATITLVFFSRQINGAYCVQRSVTNSTHSDDSQ
jgi:hypothetical protein